MSRTDSPSGPAVVADVRRRANGWPVLPMRIFLAALFLFAGYAKLSYPGFFDPKSVSGLKASVDAVKHGTPIGGVLGPLSDHPSLFGHITAFAEIAIGLGLLVGLLTRIAALGGMVLTVLIVLSIDWGGVKQYTGSSGWFTSVDLAVAAALSVFALGGADPVSLDALIWRRRLRRNARDDAEPGFRDNELDDSRRRLQGDPDYPNAGNPNAGYPNAGNPNAGSPNAGNPNAGYPNAGNTHDSSRADYPPADYRPADSSRTDSARYSEPDQPTQQLPHPPAPEPEPNSLWNAGRREPATPAGRTDGAGEQRERDGDR
ncbi:MAG: TQO small subunit DoxD [Jatrophihabitans sp.]